MFKYKSNGYLVFDIEKIHVIRLSNHYGGTEIIIDFICIDLGKIFN